MRIDLHCHTRCSPDSLNTFESVLRRMDRRGIDMVAITDHNQVAGGQEFRRRAPDRFLVGEEIKTSRGELLALFMDERVRPGLSPEETIALIRAQGGLVGVSHPLDRVRREALGGVGLETIRGLVDFIEVLNARAVFPADNLRAHELAVRWGLPGSAGSDAHAPFEVGRAYVEMPPFKGPRDFLDCLAQGQIAGRISSPFVHWVSVYARWRARLEGKL